MATAQTQKKLRTAKYVKIDSINPDSKGINFVATAQSTKNVIERTNFDGSVIKIAEVVLADETGSVTIRLVNEQIDSVPIGSTVVVRNAIPRVIQGYLRIIVNRWGKIAPHPDGVASTPAAPTQLNLQNDVSAVEYDYFFSIQNAAFRCPDDSAKLPELPHHHHPGCAQRRGRGPDGGSD